MSPTHDRPSNDAELVGRYRAALLKVHDFLFDILKESAESDLSPVQRTARGLLDRVACWVQTLHTLDNVCHYQGHMAALRSMLELTVDLGLLWSVPESNSKLEAWEASARLKSAKLFLENVGGLHSDELSRVDRAAATRCMQDSPTIAALRQQYWNGSHPSRWTGKSLISDLSIVDDRLPALELKELYFVMYQYLCWTVHGSALAGSRGLTAAMLVPVVGMAMISGGRLGLGCAELSLRLLALFDFDHQKRLEFARNSWVLRTANINLVSEDAPDSS